ncbi:hypothetical protein D3C84_1213750 [compost metagenome]
MGVFASVTIEQQSAGNFRVALGKVARQFAQREQFFLVIGQQRVEHGANSSRQRLTSSHSLVRRHGVAYLPNGLCQ